MNEGERKEGAKKQNIKTQRTKITQKTKREGKGRRKKTKAE